MRTDYLAKAADIHQRNIDAGWWPKVDNMVMNESRTSWDRVPSTEPNAPVKPRNIGELLCLVHSEIDEAYHGHVYGLFDDHLPDRLMTQVELADTAIRVYDILGYYKSKLRFTEIGDPFDFPPEVGIKFGQRLLTLHWLTSAAMEGFRKGQEIVGIMNLWHILDCLYHTAKHYDFDLDEIIDEKLTYNAQRADHKPENRAKEGGKKF